MWSKAPAIVTAFAFLARAALNNDQKTPVCRQIESAISSAADVSYPGLGPKYDEDISHWASSSTQHAECSVRPGTAADVAKILGIVGSTRTPFGVKGGGHTSNPGFSSTPGVQISMARFSEVTYDPHSGTATIGAGLIWDDVYAALAPHNVSVVGGRVSGVGVAGFTLGGGYSWTTNQFGLTIDTVTAYELVKPDGTVVNVTEASDPGVFFGLKGGFNNFGIVTRFTLKTHPQGQVWGGTILYVAPNLANVTAAIVKFSTFVADPKAAILPSFSFYQGQVIIVLLIFYDGPTPPEGIFDSFLAIDHLSQDVSTREFLSLVQGSGSPASPRTIFDTISLTRYTPRLLDAILNETTFWGTLLTPQSATFISYAVEPFLPSIFTHNTSPSAYPPDRAVGLSPFNIYFAWADESADSKFHEAVKQSAAHIHNLAISEGQMVAHAPKYPNYAMFDTPLWEMYGHNVLALQAIKATVDPTNVMGLAGGFKFQLPPGGSYGSIGHHWPWSKHEHDHNPGGY